MSSSLSKPFSGPKSRLGTYCADFPDSYTLAFYLHFGRYGASSMWHCRRQSRNLEILLDRSEQAATATFDQALPDSDEASTWSFCAIIRGEIWDPSLLTSLLNEMESTLAPTLTISAILSYACRNKSTEVPAGHVEVEGYLKLKSCRQIRRGTLRRRFMHPDLSITWTPCRIGRYRS